MEGRGFKNKTGPISPSQSLASNVFTFFSEFLRVQGPDPSHTHCRRMDDKVDSDGVDDRDEQRAKGLLLGAYDAFLPSVSSDGVVHNPGTQISAVTTDVNPATTLSPPVGDAPATTIASIVQAPAQSANGPISFSSANVGMTQSSSSDTIYRPPLTEFTSNDGSDPSSDVENWCLHARREHLLMERSRRVSKIRNMALVMCVAVICLVLLLFLFLKYYSDQTELFHSSTHS
jgi:hypothetical protein